MLMRKKPLRGEKYRLYDDTLVTILEERGKDFVTILLPTGKIDAVHKKELGLPIINTKYYEKLSER
jgi:hypothetical protein